MQVRRLDPKTGFTDLLDGINRRAGAQETRASGNIVIRETLTTMDPNTGVSAIFGQLPDGSVGFQQFVGDTTPPPIPSTPLVSSAVGAVTIIWDGTFAGSQLAPADYDHCNVYGQKVGTTAIVLAGSVVNPNDSVLYTAATGGDSWTFWLSSVDQNGNESAASPATAAITIASVLDDTALAQKLQDNTTAIDNANKAIALKSSILSASAAPSGSHNTNDIWFNTSEGNKSYRWDGANWVSTQDQSIADAQTAALNAQNTATSANNTAANAQNVAASANSLANTANNNANAAQAVAVGKNTVFLSATAPKASADGDMWVDQGAGRAIKSWSASTSAWVPAIQDGAISATQIAADTIVAGNIAAGAITASELAANSVSASALKAQSITATALAAQSITATALAAQSITATALAAQSITATALAAQSITATALAAQSITATAMAANSISATALQAGSVAASTIAAQAITASALAAGSVTANAIAANSVTASAIAAGSVTASAIAAGSITASSGIIADINADKIQSGTINARYVAIGAGTNALSDPGFNSDPITNARLAQSTGGVAGWTIANGSSTGLRKATRTTTTTSGTFSYLTSAHTFANAGQLIPCAAGQVWTLKVDTTTSVSGAGISFQAYTAKADGTVATTAIASTSISSTAQRSVSATYIIPSGVTGFMVGLVCDTSGVTWSVHGNAFVGQQVTGDLLVNGAIDGKTITGATVQTAATGARIVLDQTSLNAWNDGGDNYFSMSSASGVNVSLAGQYGYDVTRTNRCTNPSMETDISGWASAQTMVRDTTTAYNGTASLKVTNTATADRVVYRNQTQDFNPLGSCTVSAYVKHDAAAARNMRIDFIWTDNTDTAIANETYTGTAVSVAPNTWTRVSVTTSSNGSPLASTKLRMSVVGVGFAATENMWVDAVLLENVYNSVGTYFDGNTAAPSNQVSYVWRDGGTPNLTNSEERTVKNVKIKTGLNNVLMTPVPKPGQVQAQGFSVYQTPGVGFISPKIYDQTSGLFSDGQVTSIREGSFDPSYARIDVGNQQINTYTPGMTVIQADNTIQINSRNSELQLTGSNSVSINGVKMQTRRAEFNNSGTFSVNAGALWDIGALTVDTNTKKTVNNTFANASSTPGAITILEEGYYMFFVIVIPNSNPGPAWLRLYRSSDNERLFQVNNGNAYAYETSGSTVPVYISQNDTVRTMYQATNAHTINAKLKVVKVNYS